MKNALLWMYGLLSTGLLLAAPPEITNVSASQRVGTKLVDITYDAVDADGDLLKIRVEISDDDGNVYDVPAFTFTGDVGEGIVPGTGKSIVWDAGKDWDGEYSDQMRVKIYAIDAKGFPGMEWGNEVPPGGFLLGQDGGAEGSGPSRHVNIPWSYWLSKYEITRQQYCDFLNAALAAGYVYRDGTTAVHASGTAPIELACPTDILLCEIGDDECLRWNVNHFEVVDDKGNYPMTATWYGALMFSRFYGYDLPTEAEWEKAARGPDNDDEGEHLCYPWGNEISSAYAAIDSYKSVGYYNGNQTPIGPDTINGYGLYDVVGNASEWTRTRDYTIESYPQEETLQTERHEVFIQSNRKYKGVDDDALYVRYATDYDYYHKGFRVARRLDADEVSFATATCTVRETFDSWALKTTGEKTITTEDGDWGLDYWTYIQDVGIDGSRAAELNYILHFPICDDRLVFVQLKAKNTSTSVRDIRISCDLGDAMPVRLPANMQEFTSITLPVLLNGTDYRIYSNGGSGLFIDDVELWTVPKVEE